MKEDIWFQSTLPHGERPNREPLCHDGIRFQSTLPHGERLKGDRCVITVKQFQSTLPHGERLPVAANSERTALVSIHAPTWGATNIVSKVIITSLCFNPRSHMGSDCTCYSSSRIPTVSIHAPTWGATDEVVNTNLTEKFQSTLPHGERPIISSQSAVDLMFQSTLPHGERQAKRLLANSCWSFNPRSHMGSDGQLSEA